MTRNKTFEHHSWIESQELISETKKTGRTYTKPEGKKYPSITSVLSHFKKAAIMAWRKRVGNEEANKISRRACGRGNAIHSMAEKYIDNEEDYLGENPMPHVLQLWRSMQKVLDERLDKIQMQECPLWSDELKIAGRVDLIAEFDGELSIVDFKTSTRVKERDEITDYFIQECAYAQMFKERYDVDIKNLVTIMVVDDTDISLVFKEKVDDWIQPMKEKINKYYEEKQEQA